MAKYIHMKSNIKTIIKRDSKKGFYALEAAIFLPLVLLAVLSLGYFMRVEGTWENCIHGAADESRLAASRAYNEINAVSTAMTVSKRINDDNPVLDQLKIDDIRIMYSDKYADDLTSFKIHAAIDLELPLGFSRTFTMEQGIKFRGFTGIDGGGDPMGAEGLEKYAEQRPVWIFPHSGEKYHSEGCTYVKASVSPKVLTEALKKKYDSCGLCNSDSIPAGSIVFCFGSEDTAYHRGTCSSIDRHTAVIDKSEAYKKGYVPCSKCGGN